MRIPVKQIAHIVDICKHESRYPTRHLENFRETFIPLPSRDEIEKGEIKYAEMTLTYDFVSGWVLELEEL